MAFCSGNKSALRLIAPAQHEGHQGHCSNHHDEDRQRDPRHQYGQSIYASLYQARTSVRTCSGITPPTPFGLECIGYVSNDSSYIGAGLPGGTFIEQYGSLR